jgi:beta-lactam-binding protein with PASTA domain
LNLKISVWGNKYIRYPILVAGVFVVFYVFLLMVDRVIMPAVVHSGKEYLLPDVTNLSLKEAEGVLQKKDLSLKVLAEEYNPSKPPGTILSQSPGPRAKVKKGRIVKVVVSKGEKIVQVPNLKGISLRQAELMLGEEGLEVGEINWISSDSLPKDVVVNSSPSFGLSVPLGMSVNLEVSLGVLPDTVMMPNLVGKSLEEAKNILKELSLEIGEIKYEVKKKHLTGTILEQHPEAGTRIQRGSSINFTVSTKRKD